jgi:diguanylate cyclase (GGDEF)-like protein/PAS domain S-box-containing protein
MSAKAMRILLVTNDASNRRLVCDALSDVRRGSFIVEWAPEAASGLHRLRWNGIGAILLDLCCLPESTGIASVNQLLQAAPHVAILVIGSIAEENVAMQALRRGAQEYLQWNHLDSHTLPQALTRNIELKRSHEARFVEQQRAAVTLNTMGEAVLGIDVPGNVTYLNPIAERMTGWPLHEALGQPLSSVFRIIDATTGEPLRNPLDHAIPRDPTGVRAQNCLARRDGAETAIESSGSFIHDHGGSVIGAVIVFKDVSDARAISLAALYLAQHDSLTDLPNRVLLNDRLIQAIAQARRHGFTLAVLSLNVDRFKNVNDSLGQAVGDTLLQSVARRLAASIRRSDTVSRDGADEFVLLLPEIAGAHDAAVSAQKIITELTAPHDIAHHQLHITSTIGISVYPADGPDAETLLRCAETAMHDAKESGGNKYQFFEPRMNARAVERQVIEAGLHRALGGDEFLLHFQPKIALETGALTGAEALIRWVHPERGLIYPNDFITIAEDCGLIVPIGQWVLREACRQARAWIDGDLPPVPVAVNISAVEFRHPLFLENVRRILDDTQLDACHLELEVTESSLIQNPESTALVLQGLKDLGVQVAIDDFGTGYSSLSCLQRFPINVLKIDQSFVQKIAADSVGGSLVRAVINMGNSLGHRVIAEGVETEEQLAFLRDQRCGEGQGYYFSRPLAAEQFVRLLGTNLPGLVLH